MIARIGTAGWSLPRAVAADFPAEGSHLERYASRFSAVEINSSFYRPHRTATYARWAASVPAGFRFAVKMPRDITHTRRLVDIDDLLLRFLAETAALGDKRGPLLVQLPPSLKYDAAIARSFFKTLRGQFSSAAVCEARHASWFTKQANAMLSRFEIARAAADPPPVPEAAQSGGWPGLIYRRLHGSPDIYRSTYPPETLDALATAMRAETVESWCIFDNTTFGAATVNATALLARLRL